jgi:hypothetical protein
MDADRIAEIGDDWGAEDIGIVVDKEEELKQRLRLSTQQINSLEAQLIERDAVIKELQELAGRLADPVVNDIVESLAVIRAARDLGIETSKAIRLARVIKRSA